MKYLGKRFIRAAAAILVWVFAVTAAAPTSVARAFDDDIAADLSDETFDIVYEWAEETAAWFSDPISIGGESEEVFEITSSVVNGDNAKTCYKFIIENMDLNSAAACGILANIALESAFKPDALGDNGTSYGICQWHDTREGVGRWTSLKAYCDKNSLDWRSLDGQLKYLAYEADKDYPATMKAMRAVENTADGAWEAGRVWCKNFEVPANTETVSKQRGDVAKESFWPVYKDESATADTGDTGGQESAEVPADTGETKDQGNAEVTAVEGQDISVVVGEVVRVDKLCFSGIKFDSDKFRYIIANKAGKKKAKLTKAGKFTASKKTAEGTPVEIEVQEDQGGEWITRAFADVTILPKPKLKFKKLTDLEPVSATQCFSVNAETAAELGVGRWKSAKPSVAAVDAATGLITPQKNGSATITAYFGRDADGELNDGVVKAVSVSATLKVKIPKEKKR